MHERYIVLDKLTDGGKYTKIYLWILNSQGPYYYFTVKLIFGTLLGFVVNINVKHHRPKILYNSARKVFGPKIFLFLTAGLVLMNAYGSKTIIKKDGWPISPEKF